jgi:ribokinase
MKYDVITLGSATLDVFVKADEELRKHEGHMDMCYHLGEKLLIKDLEFTTGGGATNVAVAMSRLGLKTGFIGALGSDHNSDKILGELKNEKVNFLGIRINGNAGYSIILAGDSDRTILTSRGVNDNFRTKDLPKKFDTKWLYASTMMGKSFDSLKLAVKKAKSQNVNVALNISLPLAQRGINYLSQILNDTDFLILNKEEALALAGEKDLETAIRIISYDCRGIIVVTDGPNPVYVYQNNTLLVDKIKRISPVDTTGAGDAFASGFLFGLIKRKDILTCIRYGEKESASVLMHIGAKNNLLKKL